MIRGVKSSVYLMVFTVPILYFLYLFLFFQVQPTIFSIIIWAQNVGSFFLVLGLSLVGGLLGGLVRPDPKPPLLSEQELKVGIISKCSACGQEFDSNPLVCSYCGEYLQSRHK